MAGAMCRAARVARCRHDHLRARPERAGVHLPAAGRVHHQRPRRLHRRRLAGAGVRPGRPLPVQRQEVRRRPRGDDRGDPAPDPRGGRRSATATSTSTRPRWSTCRCRQSVEQQRTNFERAAEMSALIRQVEPSRAGDQHRRRDRRGGQAELDRGGAARLSRRLPRHAARAGRRTCRACPRSASRPAPRTAACRCPAAAWPRWRSTSARSSDSPRSPASTAWPAPSSTAPRPCPTSCSTASRASRRPRSTSRRASRICSTSTRRSRATCSREIEGWCLANTADERKDGESDTQFLYKTRKKALGPYKRQLWELPGKDEIIASQEEKFRYLFEQLAIGGTRELVERHITPARRSIPAPAALAEVAATR